MIISEDICSRVPERDFQKIIYLNIICYRGYRSPETKMNAIHVWWTKQVLLPDGIGIALESFDYTLCLAALFPFYPEEKDFIHLSAMRYICYLF